jgi:hypothetical protein
MGSHVVRQRSVEKGKAHGSHTVLAVATHWGIGADNRSYPRQAPLDLKRSVSFQTGSHEGCLPDSI